MIGSEPKTQKPKTKDYGLWTSILGRPLHSCNPAYPASVVLKPQQTESEWRGNMPYVALEAQAAGKSLS